ncbi:hypothetical protein N799_09895 [Lysobacter arseniciresistens ZS79]|uniref:Uncharacterized protein n=1 Tax=Lysobacter arseniciresistens ZS79 TaxID=913325 RepID=A0A0A0EVN1_9GAMM|nr:hypothetical protein N799_09895 [Lysobacter arseniciresistens ZS79]
MRALEDLRDLATAANAVTQAAHRPPDYHLSYLAYSVARVLRARLGKEPSFYVDGDYAHLLRATFAAAGLGISDVRRRMKEGRRLLDELGE